MRDLRGGHVRPVVIGGTNVLHPSVSVSADERSDPYNVPEYINHLLVRARQKPGGGERRRRRTLSKSSMSGGGARGGR